MQKWLWAVLCALTAAGFSGLPKQAVASAQTVPVFAITTQPPNAPASVRRGDDSSVILDYRVPTSFQRHEASRRHFHDDLPALVSPAFHAGSLVLATVPVRQGAGYLVCFAPRTGGFLFSGRAPPFSFHH